MGNFFKGWRRKTSLTTLFLALVFAGGWIKGGTDSNTLCVPNGTLTDELPIAGNICVGWSTDHIEGNQEVPGFQLEVTGLYGDFCLPPSREAVETEKVRTLEFKTDVPGATADFGFDVSGLSEAERSKLQRQVGTVHIDESAVTAVPEGLTTWRWQRAGFYMNRTSIGQGHSATTIFIPYWSIVIPLTLLSAALFIKPRAAQPHLQAATA